MRHTGLCLGLQAVALAVVLAGCTSYDVRTADQSDVQRLEVPIAIDAVLDVGVQLFAPELENLPDEALEFSGLRSAESVWVASRLKATLESSGAWANVRIVPDDEVLVDLLISGAILQSDGETSIYRVQAKDSSGRVWLDKTYTQIVSRYAYAPEQVDREVFQGIYNQIANDLLAALQQLDPLERRKIRKVTDMRFAASFSPDAFSEYLTTDRNNRYQIDRLPADNDPMLQRIESIRLRDAMFVEVLQDYYRTFENNMDEPYNAWREQSFIETKIIRDLNRAASARRFGGWLALGLGIAAQFSDDYYTRAAGTVAIYGGVENIRAAYLAEDEALLHIQTLAELGESLEAELEPSVIELQDRTVTMTGTTRDQYRQWREILRDIYFLETGQVPAPIND